MAKLYGKTLVFAVFRDEWCEDYTPQHTTVCERIFDSEEKAIEYIKTRIPKDAEEIVDRSTWSFAMEDSMLMTHYIDYTWIAYGVE